MLPRKRRGGRQLFIASIRPNQRLFTTLFNLEVKDLECADTPSIFSVVVSKKTAKTAVNRNLIKKRIYQIIQSELTTIKPGKGIIIFTKSGLLTTDYQTIKDALIKCLPLK